MRYDLLTTRGALAESEPAVPQEARALTQRLANQQVDLQVLELVPESVAREQNVIPLAFDGETITFASDRPDDIGLADRLRFLLAKDVQLVSAARDAIRAAIDLNYRRLPGESADSMLQEFTDTAIDFCETEAHATRGGAPMRSRSLASVASTRQRGRADSRWASPEAAREGRPLSGQDPTSPIGGHGMFFYVVEEGQRVLVRYPNGKMNVIAGPQRVWRGWKTFHEMQHFVAHPGEYLIARFRDGRQQHLPGPAELWLDPREHLSIERKDALQIAAKEAVVVYSESNGEVTRRIEYGPAMFVPQAGEWLHTFTWHASRGGSQGAQKKPGGLVFQKLWLMPDQMYHDVPDVRTGDDAVLTIRLMIFFELVDIERMLDTTHDPIGDMVNAATSDVVEFTGKHDFDSFKRNTDQLNQLETYGQLRARARQCGYQINNVVYRGYGAPESLQQMHNQAIEARTKLQLERATEQQAQDLENYKLDCQLTRATKRRTEQAEEVRHDLQMSRERTDEQRRQKEAEYQLRREQRHADWQIQHEERSLQDAQQREHLGELRNLGVDLTAFLTQARADRVIELRGTAQPHLHLDSEGGRQAGGEEAKA
jgi:hypothetical protein